VGAVAEEQGHHPDLYLAWGKVEIRIWTHKIDGLTESDFILAAKIDLLHPN
jgi:4a-hydroxytetrahydrobiopterin dehydratase